MQELRPNTQLQDGRYIIKSVLGQGGFGITYLGEQRSLSREVAIKEFFMKDYCERDDSTSQVTLGTEGGRRLVGRFREKFLKEAHKIADLDHPHIVQIIDVFEENGTAYYVMKYATGGSLADKVKREGRLTETDAIHYILQVADALNYIHLQKITHLDVKPANIMLDQNGQALLIDFGIFKQYDELTGEQTSTNQVGISPGYSPMEQYETGGVGKFSPESDVYSLGATLFFLLTGHVPPSATTVLNNGVPVELLEQANVSKRLIDVICKAMKPRRKDRAKSVQEIISVLGGTEQQASHERYTPDPDVTVAISDSNEQSSKPQKHKRQSQNVALPTNVGFVLLGVALLMVVGFMVMRKLYNKPESPVVIEQPTYTEKDANIFVSTVRNTLADKQLTFFTVDSLNVVYQNNRDAINRYTFQYADRETCRRLCDYKKVTSFIREGKVDSIAKVVDLSTEYNLYSTHRDVLKLIVRDGKSKKTFSSKFRELKSFDDIARLYPVAIETPQSKVQPSRASQKQKRKNVQKPQMYSSQRSNELESKIDSEKRIRHARKKKRIEERIERFKEPRFSCPMCGPIRSFKTERELEFHIKAIHNER